MNMKDLYKVTPMHIKTPCMLKRWWLQPRHESAELLCCCHWANQMVTGLALVIVSQTVYCVMHPHNDTSTCLIRTSTVSELNIFSRFAKNAIASLHTSGIIYYTFERDSGCLTPAIKCNRTAIIQTSQLSTRVFCQGYPFCSTAGTPSYTFWWYMLTNQSTTVKADIVTNS